MIWCTASGWLLSNIILSIEGRAPSPMYTGYFAKEGWPIPINMLMDETSPHRKQGSLKNCKSKDKITFKEWTDELTKMASFEQLIYKVNNTFNLFVKAWYPYLEMIGN